MTATPPEARAEYSRGSAAPNQGPALAGAVPLLTLIGGLLGALLLVLAEPSSLFSVHSAASDMSISSTSSGSHHAYVRAPIALLAVALSFGAWRQRSGPALIAIGALGVLTLLIAVLGDLPDAQASGLIGTGPGSYVNAHASPGTGLYLETLGAVVLIASSGVGLLLGGAVAQGTRG